MRKFVKNNNDNTLLCTFLRGRLAKFITQDYCLNFVRKICQTYGGVEHFGFHKEEIGNRSICLGAAMALFLNDHSLDKIMNLGRCNSKSFLDYICPQVVQWTRLFSNDMILFNNFFELCVTIEKRGGRKETDHFNILQSMFF